MHSKALLNRLQLTSKGACIESKIWQFLTCPITVIKKMNIPITCKVFLHSCNSLQPTLPSSCSSIGQPLIYSLLLYVSFHFPRISYKWNPTVCTVLFTWLLLFSVIILRFIHFVCIHSSCLFIDELHITICLSIHLSMTIFISGDHK